MDDHWLFVGVVVKDNDLQKTTSSIGPDDQRAPVAADQPNRIADSVVHVFIEDPVLASAVRDLHMTR